MHFNRTQFATKTLIRLFALAILLLVFLLSSCGDIDLELDKIFSQPYYLRETNFGTTIGNSPSFNVDSIRYDSISTYKVCSHIKFDSVMVLTGFVFNCWEENQQNETITVKEQVVDTLDFRSNNFYNHEKRIKTLKAKTSYMICGTASYVTGKDTILISSPCVPFKTE